MKKFVIPLSMIAVIGIFCGCLTPGYFLNVERIDDTRTDFFNITEQQYNQLPLSLKKALNNSGNRVNITLHDIQLFINITNGTSNSHSPNIIDVINSGEGYCRWWGYINYQNSIYHLYFCYYASYNYTIAENMEDIAVLINDEQMENFPSLKRIIDANETMTEVPKEEFDTLLNLLDNGYNEFIKYVNEFYKIGFAAAD